MQQIGFNNFRKFEQFPPLDLAPITILVGENNAGKSTMVKGILALSDFLNRPTYISIDEVDAFEAYDVNRENKDAASRRKEMAQQQLKNIKFRFNTSYLAHIGTFKRALYNRAKENAITFHTKLGNLSTSFKVKGNPMDEEAVSGNLSDVNIRIDFLNILLSYDLENDQAKITFNPEMDCKPSRIDESDKRKIYFSSFNKPFSFGFNISDYWSIYRGDLVDSLIECVELAINNTLYPLPKKGKNEEESEYLLYRRRRMFEDKPLPLSSETIDFLKSFSNIFFPKSKDSEEDIEDKYEKFHFPGTEARFRFSRNFEIEYLYAHAVTQTVIYSAKDTNDYLSRTIHEFASQKERNYKRNFIIKWMKEFGIGKNYRIQSVGGEAHIVHIVNNDGEEVNLADKGMGSIQLMVLLFRLAITLPSDAMLKAYSQSRRYQMSSIIIEEPEQNLHPMLQSKLADLLFELNKKYGFRFIIETHSEYLVRRSQVIVGDNFDTEEKLKKNPFKVYYFPSEGAPYDMGYMTTGLFEKKFGEGFISEAGKLHMAVLKNAKKQN